MNDEQKEKSVCLTMITHKRVQISLYVCATT